MTLKNRLTQLEKQQGKTQRMTWREFINLDGDVWQQIKASDAALAARWDAITDNPGDTERLQLMKSLSNRIAAEAVNQGATSQDDPRLSLPLAIAANEHRQSHDTKN